MKKRQLIKHIKSHGCEFLREGSNHTVYYNPAKGKTSTVPRHAEIDNMLAKKICKDLDISKI